MPKYQADYNVKPRNNEYRLKKILYRFNEAFKVWRKDGQGTLYNLQWKLGEQIANLLANCCDEAGEVRFTMNEEEATLEVRMKDELLVTYS